MVSSKDQQIADLVSELAEVRERLAKLDDVLAIEKGKLKDVWRMNSEQLAEYDKELTSKNAQIAKLQSQLSACLPLDPLNLRLVP